MHGGEVAVVGLESGEVGLHDLLVALEREDQRDVDVAALGDHPVDGRDALGRGRDLHEQVGLGDALVEHAGRLDGGLRVTRQVGRHLDGDEAVVSAALVVHRPEYAEGVADVVDDHVPVGVLDVLVPVDERAELRVVVGATLDGLLEDRGVRRHPPDPVAHLPGQLAAREVPALEVVEPRTLPELPVQPLQLGRHRSAPFRVSSVRARITTFSGV